MSSTRREKLEAEMYYALLNNDAQVLKGNLDAGGNVDHTFVDELKLNETPLHICCKKGHMECAQVLVEAGADLESRDKWRLSPLMYTVVCERSEMTQFLIEKGCDINTTDGKGKTALHAAAENLLSECMSTLLDAGASVNVTDSCSCTPLWVAATGAGTAENIRLLLQAGADLEIKDMIWKRTPLQMAVCDKHHEKVKLLLEAGADPNTVAGSIARVTPIMNLIRRDPTASQGALPTIRMLVAGGADINFYSTFGTALHVAAKVEKEPLYVNELLALGANPNTPGPDFLLPIHIAALGNKLNMVKSLVRASCQLNSVAITKELQGTPLEFALSGGHLEVARLLVQVGCKTALANYERYMDETKWRTFLQYAATPSLLMELCRLAIRKKLGQKADQLVQHLPLPSRLGEYLLLKDLDLL